MVIIAPKKYSKPLKPLIQHKNAHGIKTKFYSLQSISTLFNGRDLQEKIKHFIKFALENWQTKYVLLVGDVNEIPVRYLWNEDYGRFVFPDRYYSDLYYADIFDKHGNYVSWDSNNNNKFGEWWHNGRDQLDLHPDVYLGRLPCRNIFEVKNIVKKIINYETNTHKQPWFKKILVTGGDWIGETPGLNDADFLAEEVAKMMENKGFKAVRLYASLHNLTTKNIHTAINSGVGFIFFAPGDGLRTKWSTFINESNPVEFSVPNIKLLNNHEKLPIVVVGGCMANDIDPRGGYPTPLQQGECWGWTFVKKRNGGAIATVGSTGGCFYRNTSDFFALLEKTFFETYCKENITHLGELWGKTISNYLNISPVRWNNGETEPDGMNCKDIQMFSLIGDPSLRIGGYLHHDNPQKTKQINYTSTTKKTKQPYNVNEKKCEKEKHVETEITKTIKNHPPLNTHPPIYIEGNKDFTTENG
ncbi:MAG TPA: hypothetical protein ENI42_06580, partial [Thermoplasmatales archaeon]|nr:hypothetical protein [Thermoplasmatales archaeon]